MPVQPTLEYLIDVAGLAYQRARLEVYDRLPEGTRVNADALTERQCQILMEVEAAEADVAAYRASRRYAASRSLPTP